MNAQLPRSKAAKRLALLEKFSPVLAVLVAMAVASIALIIIGKNPLVVYGTMFYFAFGRMDSIANILYKATPLIFAGIACAVGFRVGLFNIGVEGQYLIGVLCAASVGFAVKGLPVYIHLPLAILAGAAGGALWALVPIWLKLKRGVHEVITTIMLNHTAFLFVQYLVAGPLMDKTGGMGPGGVDLRVRTPALLPTARMPDLHGALGKIGIDFPAGSVNWFLILALLAAVGLWYLLWKTPFGLELRAVGHNPKAAETAGIRSNTVIFRTFLLSGAVAGLAGLSDLLGYFGYLDIDFPRNFGFTGIAVALVGRNSAVGIVLASVLFGFLSRGGMGIQIIERVPMETYYILQGLIILCIVMASEVIRRYARAQQKKEEASPNA